MASGALIDGAARQHSARGASRRPRRAPRQVRPGRQCTAYDARGAEILRTVVAARLALVAMLGVRSSLCAGALAAPRPRRAAADLHRRPRARASRRSSSPGADGSAPRDARAGQQRAAQPRRQRRSRRSTRRARPTTRRCSLYSTSGGAAHRSSTTHSSCSCSAWSPDSQAAAGRGRRDPQPAAASFNVATTDADARSRPACSTARASSRAAPNAIVYSRGDVRRTRCQPLRTTRRRARTRGS